MPALLFVILGTAFVVPLFPADWPLLIPLEALGTEWKIIVIGFVAILLTGLLYNLNGTIIRLYRGLSWKDYLFGTTLTTRNVNKLDIAHAQRRALRTMREEVQQRPQNPEREALVNRITAQQSSIATRIYSEFPDDPSQVLPTRLGNVISSFESYPDRQYGIDATALWPRMIGTMDKDYGAAVADAKTSLDFSVNSSLLSGITALAIFIVGSYYRLQLDSVGILIRHLMEILIFVIAAIAMYLSSIERAKEWGEMYKGAFDLYRGGLLKQLGYKQIPETVNDEISLWDPISRQIIYGYPPADKGHPVPYTFIRTSASGKPLDVDLVVTRGVTNGGNDGSIEVK